MSVSRCSAELRKDQASGTDVADPPPDGDYCRLKQETSDWRSSSDLESSSLRENQRRSLIASGN